MKTLAAIAILAAVIVLTATMPAQPQPKRADLSWMDIYTMSQWTNPDKEPFVGCPHLMYFTKPPDGGSTTKVENPTLWGDPMQQIKEDLDKELAAHRSAIVAKSHLNGHRIIE
jgi:hypothetical protein